jgi:type VI secretion system secreted protein VgrG
MSQLTAVARPFRLQTKSGIHDLWIRSFSGEEAVSKLFRFRLLAHADSHIPLAELLGQDVAFVIELRNQERRFLAKIAFVEELGLEEHHRVLYGLELVPRLWATTQTIRARVFEDKDPLDIVKEVLSESGSLVSIDRRPDSDHARPYCVQYFESDFDFAVRLLEEEGYIYLCGSHEGNPALFVKHFPSPFPSLGPLPFHEGPGGPGERIASWKKTRVLTATAVNARDHLFHAMSPVLEGTASVPGLEAAMPGWEPLDAPWSAPIDRYPGEWAHLFDGGDQPREGYNDFGAKRAWRDLRQVAGSASAGEGAGNCHRLAPGHVFELEGRPASRGEYFVVSVRHRGSQALDHSTGGNQEFDYENQFTAVPYASTTMYLPPRATRKPAIHGCQTAQVVGAPGAGEIWTDKFGRVQVRFWWDKEGANSCWIRVATPWAGSNWGVQHIPRVGQEVVVAFLDGDPDRPLIVGSVCNPSQMPPFELPRNRTQSGIRTNSTPGGERAKANEIRFEDKHGGEKVYIRAQKDRYDVVERDCHVTTKRDKREVVGGDSDATVGGDCMTVVGGKLGIGADEIHLQARKIVIEADAISIRTTNPHGEFIRIDKSGGITIESKGERVWINCGGADTPEEGCLAEPAQPEDPFAPPTE